MGMTYKVVDSQVVKILKEEVVQRSVLALKVHYVDEVIGLNNLTTHEFDANVTDQEIESVIRKEAQSLKDNYTPRDLNFSGEL